MPRRIKAVLKVKHSISLVFLIILQVSVYHTILTLELSIAII